MNRGSSVLQAEVKSWPGYEAGAPQMEKEEKRTS